MQLEKLKSHVAKEGLRQGQEHGKKLEILAKRLALHGEVEKKLSKKFLENDKQSHARLKKDIKTLEAEIKKQETKVKADDKTGDTTFFEETLGKLKKVLKNLVSDYNIWIPVEDAFPWEEQTLTGPVRLFLPPTRGGGENLAVDPEKLKKALLNGRERENELKEWLLPPLGNEHLTGDEAADFGSMERLRKWATRHGLKVRANVIKWVQKFDRDNWIYWNKTRYSGRHDDQRGGFHARIEVYTMFHPTRRITMKKTAATPAFINFLKDAYFLKNHGRGFFTQKDIPKGHIVGGEKKKSEY
jgi:hypothetical protein